MSARIHVATFAQGLPLPVFSALASALSEALEQQGYEARLDSEMRVWAYPEATP